MGQSRILIIDDDPDISEAMRVVLENAGFSVDYAEDGNKGLGQMKSARPDLIILDVMMNTSQEGFVVSRTIKNNPDYKDIPIVMLTAVKKKTGIDFKAEAGDKTWLPVDEFLDKPVKPDVLVETVNRLLDK